MKQLYIEKSIGIDFQKEITSIALLGKTLQGMELLDYHIWQNGSNGSEESERQLIASLNDFMERNGLKNIRGAFCFPRHDIILKYIDIPTPKKENIKDILEYEIERHVPLTKDEIYYDFQIIKQREENLYNVLIAVSRKSQVDHCINLLKEASIIPSMVSLSTVSNFNLLSFIDYDRKILNAVIEISFRGVNISFILDNSVVYTRSITTSGNDAWKKSLLDEIVSNVVLEAAAKNFTEFLIREINLSLASCREIVSEQVIDCFYLSGGGLLTEPVKKHLEQRITGKVQLLDPLIKLQSRNYDISEKDRNFLANAIGAGIQNHIKSEFYINFLPEALKKYAQDHSLKTMLILSGIFVFVLFITFASAFFKEYLTLNDIENEIKKIKKEVIIADNFEREYEQISRQQLFLKEIQTSNPSRLIILKELTTILPSDVWLQNLVIKQSAAVITGTADSTSKLVPLLEQSDLFTDVHFVDSISHVKDREQFKMKLPLKNVVVK
jgi:Tfp pilus assembly PilM family ATPase